MKSDNKWYIFAAEAALDLHLYIEHDATTAGSCV